jgi:hypothetical protein
LSLRLESRSGSRSSAITRFQQYAYRSISLTDHAIGIQAEDYGIEHVLSVDGGFRTPRVPDSPGVAHPTLRSRLQNVEVDEDGEVANIQLRIGDDQAFAESVRGSGDERAPSSERPAVAVEPVLGRLSEESTTATSRPSS